MHFLFQWISCIWLRNTFVIFLFLISSVLDFIRWSPRLLFHDWVLDVHHVCGHRSSYIEDLLFTIYFQAVPLFHGWWWLFYGSKFFYIIWFSGSPAFESNKFLLLFLGWCESTLIPCIHIKGVVDSCFTMSQGLEGVGYFPCFLWSYKVGFFSLLLARVSTRLLSYARLFQWFYCDRLMQLCFVSMSPLQFSLMYSCLLWPLVLSGWYVSQGISN